MKEENGQLDEISSGLAQKALDLRMDKGIKGPYDRFSAFRASVRVSGDKNPALRIKPSEHDYSKPADEIDKPETDAELYKQRPSRKLPVEKPLKEATHIVHTRRLHSSERGPAIKVTANDVEEAMRKVSGSTKNRGLVVDKVERISETTFSKFRTQLDEVLKRSEMTDQDRKYMGMAHSMAKAEIASHTTPAERGEGTAQDREYLGMAKSMAKAEIASHTTPAERGEGSEEDKKNMKTAKALAKSALPSHAARVEQNTKQWQNWSKGVREEVARMFKSVENKE